MLSTNYLLAHGGGGRLPMTLNVSVIYNAYSVHLSPYSSIINEAFLSSIDTAQTCLVTK